MADAQEQMEFDVVIIGAGPAGLSAAIRLKQLCKQHAKELSVCVLEKGSEVGAHILSGAVLETRALDELLPDWQQQGAPLQQKVTHDRFCFLSAEKSISLPTPPKMRNHGNYIISLGLLCRWLAQQAEALDVSIFPGFPAAELIVENEKVVGVLTSQQNDQPGVQLRCQHLLVAEGARGSLSRQLIERFKLQGECAQTYGLGVKEIWQIDSSKHQAGSVLHTVGWPLEPNTYGGSFIYHMPGNKISLGFVVGLDYSNPYLNPFDELQKFKTHPTLKSLLGGGERIAYGARALTEGGYQSIPKLTFPGGFLIGCAAGFMNVPKIKGNHTAMKSGMLAAECIFNEADYDTTVRNSWIGEELQKVRNIRPGFKFGLVPGLCNAALETYITQGKSPWTLKHKIDYKTLKPAKACKKPNYPKADNKLTFDRLTSVRLTATSHREGEPGHLILKDPEKAITLNYKVYDSPEQYYCPAAVYEIVQNEQQAPYLQINAGNCIHCKTCDIKDPSQNIIWKTPEGGDGPNYGEM
jgi:electron-transferring-flavoprotein dehydrogenase